MPGRMDGKRVIVIQAEDFMGPELCKLFKAEGAKVIAASRNLRETGAADEVVREAVHFDILIANGGHVRHDGSPVASTCSSSVAANGRVLCAL